VSKINKTSSEALGHVISSVLLGVCYAYLSEAVAVGWLALICSGISLQIRNMKNTYKTN
jgi:hypothetical protein